MDRGINAMPLWLLILDAFPGYPRTRRSFWQRFHHWKRPLFNLCYKILPMALFAASVVVGIVLVNSLLPLDSLTRVALILGPPIASMVLYTPAVVFCVVYILGALLLNQRALRHAVWRKRLAALLSVRYGLGPGGLAALLEDDDQMALQIQRFLAEHQVPYRLPLYDAAGKYLFAAPEKVNVLATALLRAVGKGRDNELFVLLVDLLELDDHLEPLLRSVRVALGRHHQVIIVCPWPPRMALPGAPVPEQTRPASPKVPAEFQVFLRRSQRQRFHDAYNRLRRTFARLGVTLVCAASDEPVPLILDRLDRLRSLRRRR
jgi:hypothetical protein